MKCKIPYHTLDTAFYLSNMFLILQIRNTILYAKEYILYFSLPYLNENHNIQFFLNAHQAFEIEYEKILCLLNSTCEVFLLFFNIGNVLTTQTLQRSNFYTHRVRLHYHAFKLLLR